MAIKGHPLAMEPDVVDLDSAIELGIDYASEREADAYEKGIKEGESLANLRYGPFKPRFQG